MAKGMTVILAGIIMLSFYVRQDEAVGKEERIIYIINSLEKLEASIQEWSIYYKNDIQDINSLDDLRTIESDIKNKYQNFKWSREVVNEHHIKMTGIKINDESKEQLSVTAIKEGDKYKVSQTFNYTGFIWSIKSYLKILKDVKNPDNMFFTVKGIIDLPRGSNLSSEAQMILKEMSASPIESLEELEFVSISAYKDQWGSHLLTRNNKNMNLQIGLRRNGEEGLTQIIVGSPIIIVEY